MIGRRVRALLCAVGLAIAADAHGQDAAAVPTDREIRVASDAFVKDPVTPGWVSPHAITPSTAPSTTAGPAVLLLLEQQVLIGAPTVTYVRNAIQVNDAAALTPLGRVPVVFIPAYQKVRLHTLQVIRDGAVLDRLPGAQVRFLQRETGLERNLYDGLVTASILLDDLRVGDTIEVAFSIAGTNPVFGDRFGNAENWDQQWPVDVRRLAVSAPVARPLRWRFHRGVSARLPQPVERVRDGLRTLTFEEHDLPRVASEALTPAGVSAFRWVQFSEYDGWPAIATWASSLFDVAEAPDAVRAALVAQLMAKPTVEERVVAALEFVQEQVRYFSVSLGTSSHRPTPPNAVLARRYGDCKDKSLLLVTLLADMGIPSTPVLARLGNRTGFDDWLPTPLAFDHVIVAVDVDGARYWLDATRLGQHGRLVTMGQAHDGAEVLPASRSDGRLVRIDVPDRERLAASDVAETFVVEKLDGDATLDVVQTLHGVAAETLRASLGLLTRERIDEGVSGDMQKRYAGAKLADSPKIDDDRVDNRMTMTARFVLTKPVVHAGDQYQLPFQPANFARVFALPPESVRHSPLALRYPIDATYHLSATFPDTVAMVETQRTRPIEDRWFKAKMTDAMVANRATVDLSIETRGDRVAAADLPTLRGDLAKLGQWPSVVVVRQSDVRDNGFLGLGAKDFATVLKQRQEDTVAKVTKALDGGRLSGGDLARAYCTRASASAALGRRDEARQDADRAVDGDPNDAAALVCRAGIHLAAGEFAAADDDASQAIVLGADTGAAWHVRGEARFERGRFDDAAADFAKAATVDVDDYANANHDVWRAMAARRAGKPLPDDLARRAADAEHGRWPRPALLLFANRLDPDGLSRLVAGRSRDEAAMAGTEADFYIGEFHLANGDVDRARASFAAACARGVIVYAEYQAATAELARLDGAARP